MTLGLVAGSAVLGVAAGALANGLAARIGPVRYAAVRSELDQTGMDEGLRFVAPLRPTTVTCEDCGAGIMVGPVLPWLAAGGRCRACGASRRRIHLAVELLTAAAFALLANRYGATSVLLPLFVLTGALSAASLVDLAYGRLPNAITFPALGIVSLLVIAISVDRDLPGALAGAAVGASLYYGFLLVMHLISPRGMGFGDVKLALPMGLVLGWLGWSGDLWILGPLVLVMYAAMLGSLLAAVIGFAIARALKTAFPLGPFLALGTYVVVLFASDLRPT
ncbi:MAG: prepilin peptidase [Acidimicrobiales bacterium]